MDADREIPIRDSVGLYLERFRSFGLDGVPCKVSDVKEVERYHRVTLPAAYQAYLLIAGRHPPKRWAGSDCTIDRLPELRKWSDELLAECNQPSLPAEAFVFIMHQGYQFMYFLADGTSVDPPVSYYLEGEPSVIQKFERFSDLIFASSNEG